MTEEVQQTSQEPSVSPSEPTLEDVYQTYKVEDAASQFQAQPVQQQPQAQPIQQDSTIPDPVLDSQGFKNWQAQQTGQLRQAVLQAQGQSEAVARYLAQQKEEADIQKAISTVKSKVPDLDDDAIEISLGIKARKDQRFMQIYKNRDKNPQAWNAALAAVGNELKSKFQMRTDPQLTENVRAAKASTQTSLTTNQSESSNPLERVLNDAKDGRDWEARWNKIVHGGN